MVTFMVWGMPAPQGSKRFMGIKGGKGVMTESSKKVLPWRQDVGLAAEEAMRGRELLSGALVLDIVFLLPRPASVSIKKRPHPSVKPDLSKLVRSTEDALTGKVWFDDAQICSLQVSKKYSSDGRTGAEIRVFGVMEP